MSGLELARAAFRDGARALDPERRGGAPTPDVLRAWLTIQTVRTQPKWLRAAAQAVQELDLATVPDDAVADWVDVCCRGWVQQAIGPFRSAARALLPRLPDTARSAPALLGWWRITGERAPLDRALSLLRGSEGTAPWLGVALRLGYHATADGALRDRALACFGSDPGTLPPSAWAAAADLGELDAEAFVAPLTQAQPDDPEVAPRLVPAAAALALPALTVQVLWFIEDELREGPMAEAATFPWAALRLRFTHLPGRDQIRFVARLGDGEEEELDDVGVAAPWLGSITGRVDRGPLLDGAPRRGRRSGGLRR